MPLGIDCRIIRDPALKYNRGVRRDAEIHEGYGYDSWYYPREFTTSMKAIRIVLADDHQLVRAGIRSLVEKIPGIEVVAEASDGREAIAHVSQFLPDIALMDIAMPSLNGLEAAPRIVKNFPGVKVILLSAYANEEYVLQALRSGVSGYLLKDAVLEELQLALKVVLSAAKLSLVQRSQRR
jgi:DNA-binding NarL/FixJ family response regulator